MSEQYDGTNPIEELRQTWNKRLKSLRITGLVLSIIMIIAGILCFVYPLQAAYALEIFVTILLIAFGVVEIVEFFSLPAIMRTGGLLVSGLLNILLAWLLLSSQSIYMLAIFGFLFAFILLLLGIEQLVFHSRLSYFGITEGTGWLMANGIICLIAGVVFLFSPIASSAAMSILVGCYLLVGGVTMLIEFFKTKELKVE